MKSPLSPLLKTIRLDSVALVLAPDLEIVERSLLGSLGQFEALIRSHEAGVQRVGIVPKTRSTDTRYFVLEFFPLADEPGRTPLDDALSAISVLKQEHVVFENLSDDPSVAVLGTMAYSVPVYLERHASLDDERYQLWFLFDRPVDLASGWLMLQSLLISLEIRDGANVLPFPQYRAHQHTEDVVWLPGFSGVPDRIRGKLLGGVPDGRTVFLDVERKPPVPLNAPALKYETIPPAEFDRLRTVLEPFLPQARRMMPSHSENAVRWSPPTADAGVLSDELDSTNRLNRLLRESEADLSSDPRDSDPTTDRRAWQSVLENVRKDIERAGFFTTGRSLDEDFDMFRPILKARVLQFPVQFLRLWREAVSTVLGVDTGWVDDLVCEAFDDLALDGSSLGPILRRARAAGLSESHLTVIILRWLDVNGGTFAASPGGCVLTYKGTDYPIMVTPPFSSLVWNLSRDSGHPVLLTSSMCDSALNEALFLAEARKAPSVSASRSSAGPTRSIPASAIGGAIQRLFELATGPDAKAREAVEKFVQVNRTTGPVDISGTGQDVCSTLNLASGKPFLSGVDDLRKALTDATEELRASGITWEESSAGRGKRRVFHLKRSA